MSNPLEQFFTQIQQIASRLEQAQDGKIAFANTSEANAATLSTVLQLAIATLSSAEEEVRQQQETILETQQIAAAERLRYYDLFEGAPDAYIVTDTFGKIQAANRAAILLLNVPAAYIVGKPLSLYIVEAERRDFRHFLAELSGTPKHLIQEKEFQIQSRGVPEPTPVSIRVTTVNDAEQDHSGFRWLMRDITERRRYQSQLDASNDLLESLFNASPMAIIALDFEGRVTLWNTTAEEMFGWHRGEVMGNLVPLVQPDSMNTFRTHLNTLSQTAVEYVKEETDLLHRDQHLIPVRISAASVSNGNAEKIGVIALVEDMSDIQQHLADLRAVKTRLTLLRDAERRRHAQNLHDEVMQQLVALQFQMAHLRSLTATPTANAMERIEKGLGVVGGEMGAIVRLVRTMINDLHLPGLEAFGLVQVLRDYINQWLQGWDTATPTLDLSVPEEDMEIPLPLATVLLFVAQTALRNVRHHAHAQHVSLALAPYDAHIMLTVQDDGRGFEAPRRLADLAYAGHFGLLEAVEQVESLGGTLEILSTPGSGTTLMVRVPLHADTSLDNA